MKKRRTSTFSTETEEKIKTLLSQSPLICTLSWPSDDDPHRDEKIIEIGAQLLEEAGYVITRPLIKKQRRRNARQS